MTIVRLENITKRFGETTAVENVSFDVKESEFFTLLGPSGCGKTTLLRIISGFCEQDHGDIYFDRKLINDIPPHKRNVGLVFQNYALFPHLNVLENIAYGLKARNIQKNEIKNRVHDALELVRLPEVVNRKPSQLSGGQQQRIALARALVIEPCLLLMDEPLSNVDAKMRITMREDIRKLQKRLKITTIYVTHDQIEALVISDRIAVMNVSRIEQIGSSEEIYNNPQSRYVADFIGTTNFLEGRVKAFNQAMRMATIDCDGLSLKIPVSNNLKIGDKVSLAVRPQSIIFVTELAEAKKSGFNIIDAVIEAKHFLGSIIRYTVRLKNDALVSLATLPGQTKMKEGQKVKIGVRDASCFNLAEEV